MCGRFAQKTSYSELKKLFGLTAAEVADVPPVKARYNIAPTQDILNVRQNGEERVALMLKWGLVPSWANDATISARLINARSETVEEKPSFREAFKHRRCLIPTDGFYEWQRNAGGAKQPYFFQLRDEESPFAFAGLWERWKSTDGKVLETCTILTTQANEVLAPVHDRMPVIIHPADYDLWLNEDERQRPLRRELLRPFPAEEMTSHPVGLKVNSPSEQGEELQRPIELNSL